MCIIISKGVGVDLPKEHQLKNSFDNNPDGFGLAFWRKGDELVTIRKGAMTWEATKEMVASLGTTKEVKEMLVVLHFRHSTSGAIDGGNCHPFPITGEYDVMREVEIKTPIAIFHNGIIQDYYTTYTRQLNSQWYDPVDEKEDPTDTQWFVKEYLNLINLDSLMTKPIMNLVRGMCGGSFLFLSMGKVSSTPTFSTENGCFFSNYSYRTIKTKVTVIKSKKDDKENVHATLAKKTDKQILDAAETKVGADGKVFIECKWCQQPILKGIAKVGWKTVLCEACFAYTNGTNKDTDDTPPEGGKDAK